VKAKAMSRTTRRSNRRKSEATVRIASPQSTLVRSSATPSTGSDTQPDRQRTPSITSDRTQETCKEAARRSQQWSDLLNVISLCLAKRTDRVLCFLALPLTVVVSLWLSHRLVVQTAVLSAVLWSRDVQRMQDELRHLLVLSLCLSVWRILRAALNEFIAIRWRRALSEKLHSILVAPARITAEVSQLPSDEHREATRPLTTGLHRGRFPLMRIASERACCQLYEQVTTSSLRMLSLDLISLVSGGTGGAGGLVENAGTVFWQFARTYQRLPLLPLLLGLGFVLGSYTLIWLLAFRVERVNVQLDAAETALRTQYMTLVEQAETYALHSCGCDALLALETHVDACCRGMRQLGLSRLPLVFMQHITGYGSAWLAYAAAVVVVLKRASSDIDEHGIASGAKEELMRWTSQFIAELLQLLGSLVGLLQLCTDMRAHALQANRVLSLCRLVHTRRVA
jgi:ABC-type uncharacterized transport system fused permease/ATPase subunit